MYDVIIVGAGPAGISASLYIKRSNLKPLVFYSDKSSLEKTDAIENYYGFKNKITGKELYDSGIGQAEKIGVEIKKEEVIAIGDNVNDQTMLENAGLGVAMANSAPYIQQMANIVTESNNEDGIAKVIEKYILE